jgi:predicted Zn-dependent protease
VNGLPAVRATTARTREGRIALDLTWIAHAGRICRITGAKDPNAIPEVTPAVRSTVQSFSPLTPRERAAIRETRLHIVSARRGETLADVLARAHSSWNVATAAVANGLDGTGRLENGQAVKVAIEEPYTR